MRDTIIKWISDFIDDYCKENNLERIWEEPIVGFADANSDYIKNLKNVVLESHYSPKDFLEDATIIVSYFLPFKREIGKSNKCEGLPSEAWAKAYIDTNKMAQDINEYIVDEIEKLGYKGVNPVNAGVFDQNILKSNWSQRHMAYAAGIGTFGINNLLISEKGSCGRYFSVITNLDVKSDEPIKEERCMYKKDKLCGVCVKRCKNNALTYEGFDRFKCSSQLQENKKILGASVCGKCAAELPCSYKNPVK